MAEFYQSSGDRLRLQIFVQPKSSKTCWGTVAERDGRSWIQLKIASPPVEGAANKEVIKFLAKQFKTAQSNVRIIQGEKSRYKLVALTGYNELKLQEFLRMIPPG
jgi:hypothetical protein